MNREKFSSFDKEAFIQIPDEKIEQAIIDYILDIVIKDDWKNEYLLIKSLSPGFQYVYSTWILENEVNNGGFNQYFYNSSGQFAEEAISGFQAFGADGMANILQGAIDTLFDEIDLYRKTKAAGSLEAFMDSYEESSLDIWDDKFYEYPNDLSKLRIEYIRNNMNEFIKK